MPDAFGNLTPSEVAFQIQEDRTKRNTLAQQGGPGVQAGQALANIFGPAIQKTVDTKKAREAEAVRLVKTEGISLDEARKKAKSSVGREFADIRKAKRIEEANSEMTQFMAALPESVSQEMKQAQGMLFMSNRLRSMGLTTQANNLAAQASAAISAAETKALERKNLLSQISARGATEEKTRRETEFVGTTSFAQNVIRKEQIIGQLSDPQSDLDQQGRDALLREKGHLEAKILKDETLVGRTAEDVRSDQVLQRKLFNDVSESDVLLAQLNLAEEQLGDLSTFDATKWAEFGKDAIAFGENWLGRKPSESEQQFVARVIKARGGATLISAGIRHALTGAQMSAFEIAFLTPFLPGPGDSREQMLAKIRTVKEYTALDRDTRVALFNSGNTMKTLREINGLPLPEAKSEETPAPQSDEFDQAIGAGLASIENMIQQANSGN